MSWLTCISFNFFRIQMAWDLWFALGLFACCLLYRFFLFAVDHNVALHFTNRSLQRLSLNLTAYFIHRCLHRRSNWCGNKGFVEIDLCISETSLLKSKISSPEREKVKFRVCHLDNNIINLLTGLVLTEL